MVLWERQKGEPKASYDAFWFYCNIPKEQKRTFVLVAKRFAKSDTYFRKQAKAWNWEERVLAYDNHLLKLEFEALKNERIDAARRHVKISRSIQGKIIKRLHKMEPNELSPSALTSLLDLAIKIERQALGEPTELIAQELSGPNGTPIEYKRNFDLSGLSKEELMNLENILLKVEKTGSE